MPRRTPIKFSMPPRRVGYVEANASTLCGLLASAYAIDPQGRDMSPGSSARVGPAHRAVGCGGLARPNARSVLRFSLIRGAHGSGGSLALSKAAKLRRTSREGPASDCPHLVSARQRQLRANIQEQTFRIDCPAGTGQRVAATGAGGGINLVANPATPVNRIWLAYCWRAWIGSHGYHRRAQQALSGATREGIVNILFWAAKE